MILSAYIRLAEVGIGCDPWPACYAILDPAEQQGIAVLTEEGQEMGHRGARLAHRYIASALGLFIVALFAASLRRKTRATGLIVPSALLAITTLLSILGYYTPSRDIPLITMGNLLGGMAMLGLLWWMTQREAESDKALAMPTLRKLAQVALCLVSIQIVLGGWSSANYASDSCPNLLSCVEGWSVTTHMNDSFNPLRKVHLNAQGKVESPAGVGALSMVHRGFALFTAGYLAWFVRKARAQQDLRSAALTTSGCSIGLVLLGVGMIWFELPLLLVSLHNALAAGLLLACIQLLHRLTPALTRR